MKKVKECIYIGLICFLLGALVTWLLIKKNTTNGVLETYFANKNLQLKYIPIPEVQSADMFADFQKEHNKVAMEHLPKMNEVRFQTFKGDSIARCSKENFLLFARAVANNNDIDSIRYQFAQHTASSAKLYKEKLNSSANVEGYMTIVASAMSKGKKVKLTLDDNIFEPSEDFDVFHLSPPDQP
jgi:hypothetical protein